MEPKFQKAFYLISIIILTVSQTICLESYYFLRAHNTTTNPLPRNAPYYPGKQLFYYPFSPRWPLVPVRNLGTTPSIAIFPSLESSSIASGIPNDALNSRVDQYYENECGKAAVYRGVSGRIVNGEPAQYGEFPWLVAIMRENGRSHLCGGSLISDQYILSAAHCFDRYHAKDVTKLRVLIGDYNIYDPSDVKLQVRSVTRLIRHKKWSKEANFNDVALLKLAQPVRFSPYVQPVCLATKATFYGSGTAATVAGWGKVQWGNAEIQQTPQKIDIPLVDASTCQRATYPNIIGDSMICAGGEQKSTCLGDSGGPLTVYSNGRWYQVGIVSWGLYCDGYGVYTRVSSFMDWIDKWTNK